MTSRGLREIDQCRLSHADDGDTPARHLTRRDGRMIRRRRPACSSAASDATGMDALMRQSPSTMVEAYSSGDFTDMASLLPRSVTKISPQILSATPAERRIAILTRCATKTAPPAPQLNTVTLVGEEAGRH